MSNPEKIKRIDMTTDSQIKIIEIRRIENTTESKIMEGNERLRKGKNRRTGRHNNRKIIKKTKKRRDQEKERLKVTQMSDAVNRMRE